MAKNDDNAQGALGSLLVAARNELNADGADNDGLFDELAGVGDEQEAEQPTAQNPAAASPAAPAPHPAAAAAPADDGAGEEEENEVAAAVRRAVAAVEPDLAETAAQDNADLGEVDPAELESIARPNGEKYQPRRLFHLTDVLVLRRAREVDAPVMLAGYPGCGKTALVEAAFGEELVTLNAHGDMEVADLIGTYTQKPNGNYEWVDGPLVVAMREGRPLFIDDITLAPATVLARLYPAMDGRKRITIPEHKGETVEAKDGFFVVGAHNPGVHGAIFSEPLRSRFIIPITIETDLSMALQMGVESRIVNGTAALHKLRAEGTITWAPEMRELLAFKRNSEAFGSTFAVNALIAAAPEEARDVIASTLRTWYPRCEALRVAAK